jgi:hypothetical protein
MLGDMKRIKSTAPSEELGPAMKKDDAISRQNTRNERRAVLSGMQGYHK